MPNKLCMCHFDLKLTCTSPKWFNSGIHQVKWKYVLRKSLKKALHAEFKVVPEINMNWCETEQNTFGSRTTDPCAFSTEESKPQKEIMNTRTCIMLTLPVRCSRRMKLLLTLSGIFLYSTCFDSAAYRGVN